jgi:protein MAK16
MIQDDVVWKIINNGHCAYKSKTVSQTFCRNQYNLTGMCNRHSCPLSNSRYATVLEEKGQCYLYMKTPERAHLPNQLWEKVKLPRNYQQALEMVDENLEFWGKFQRHKCKQRLTKLHQMIIRKRKLKISDSHTQEQLVRINKKYEKRETNREAAALKAAQLERSIEKELLSRLKVGTFYKDIYNLDQKDFEQQLDENEVVD